MSGKTSIEWTGATWNPIVGCSIKLAQASDDVLFAPLRRKKPTTYFVNSMGDLFHEDVPDEWIDRVFAVMALCPQHTFQCLTKRAARMRDYFSPGTRDAVMDSARDILRQRHEIDIRALSWDCPAWPLLNVWLGVSTERQQEADERIMPLLDTPAAVRFISAEPLLGPIDLTRLCILPQKPGSVRAGIHLNAMEGRYCESGVAYTGDWDVNGPPAPVSEWRKLDWVIVGGESGPGARPMHPAWARSLRDQCGAAGVPYFFKQWGEWQPRYYYTTPDASGKSVQLLDLKQTITSIVLHASEPKQFPVNMIRLGKKLSGRELDGVLHDAMPELRP
jgi:protein gp37